MNKICILGSINMDLVYHVREIPKEGETILSKGFEKNPGGKGANQAVAAKRCGADVFIIAKVGKDDNGRVLVSKLNEDSINTKKVLVHENLPTGTAVIMVNDKGNNSIIVEAGSNMAISNAEISEMKEEFSNCDILIAQFETPVETTLEAFRIAKSSNNITILNPAPAREINSNLLKVTDIIIPNETEVEIITGIKVFNLESAKIAGEKLLKEGVKFVIITLGSEGAAIIGEKGAVIIPAFKVKAIDTTAAGDSFIGALSTKLNIIDLSFNNIVEGVTFANKVASITVQRKGAQPSIPYINEIY